MEKEIIKKEETQIVERRLTSGKPAGLDDVDMQQDLKIPRLAILQSTSKMVSDGKGKLGDLAHSISKENYGDSIEIIPIFMFKSRAKFEVGQGLVMLSRDNRTVHFGVGKYEQFINKNVEDIPHDSNPNISAIEWNGKEPPSFSLVYNFFCLLAGPRIFEFPLVLSLMRTAVPTAKDFLSMITFANEDMFSRVYKIVTKKEENEKGTYAVPKVEFLRRATDEEYKIAASAYNEFYRKRKDISVDLEEEAPDYSKDKNE